MKNVQLLVTLLLLSTIAKASLYPPPLYRQIRINERNTTQYYFMPYLINPAFVGNTNSSCFPAGRLAMNYRNSSFDENYGTLNSIQIGYDQYVHSLGGVGMVVTHNNSPYEGVTHSTARIMYAHILPVTRKFTIRTGIQAGFGQVKTDESFFRRNSGMQPVDKVLYPDFSFGIAGYTKRFFTGIAVHHLTEPVLSFYGTDANIILRRFTIHGGLEIPLNKKENPFTLAPNLIMYRQSGQTNILMGTYLNKNRFVSGVWFNNSYNRLMILLGYNHPRFRVGLSTDRQISYRNHFFSSFSHEISLSVNLFENRKKHKFRSTCLTSLPVF